MDFANIAAQLNAGVILPEGIVIVTIMVIIVTDIIGGRGVTKWLPYVAIAGLLAAIADLFLQWGAAEPIAFLGSFNGDDLSIVFRGIIALSAVVTIPMCIRYIERSGTALAEFLAILLAATLGGMFLSGADELVTVFVSLETLSISSYLLTGYMKRDPRSNEAALKYLLIGAASAAIFLYGMSLLYGLSGGETNLAAIATQIAASNKEAPIGLIVALVFVIAGIAFKVAAVPFHQWTPDVYEGSPTPVVAFLSVGSKTAGFALAIRLLLTAFPMVSEQWRFVFAALAILSMVLGNVVALAQTSMKRLLAYSSIGQAGVIMIGFIIGTDAGYSSVIFYLFIYLFMNLGAFTCVILFSLRTGTDQISEYSGLYQKDPLLTLCLSVCLLSLGGIPPLSGFFGKIYVFWAGWQSGAYTLVLVGLITSVISIYYYIRVVKMMVVKEPQEMSDVVKTYSTDDWDLPGMQPLRASLVLAVVVTALSGVLANPLLTLANSSVARTPLLQRSVLARSAEIAAIDAAATAKATGRTPVSTPEIIPGR
ncbi:MAG: NAD(P)H-quinone oxidoreductase subunit N [Phormidesmis sp.]